MSSTQVLSPHLDVILDSLQYQGASNDCGPYTAATVLNAMLDLDLDGNQLARQMDKPVWRGPRFVIRRVPNWATFPWGMVDVMRAYGLKASWRPFASTDDLKHDLIQGLVPMPVIGSLKPLWAHVMTLLAWNPHKGWGFANTQFSHQIIHWISDDYFKSHWREVAHILIEAKRA